MKAQTINTRVIKTEEIAWKTLQFIQDDNFKEWIGKGDEKLIQSLLKYQFADPFKVWSCDGVLWCLDGKHRFLDLIAVEKLGHTVPEMLPATFIACADIKEAAELVLIYSSAYARITSDGLTAFIEKFNLSFPDMKDTLAIPEFDMMKFEAGFNETSGANVEIVARNLQEQFLIPPFSIFDSRQGYWQERKRQWLSLGFNSQETREDVELVAKSGQSPAIYELRNTMRNALQREPEWDEILDEARKRGLHIYQGASIFDPVICEVCYRWFCPPGGLILDPFAGGSVRGIVAGILGYHYEGIDLREDQCLANREQWSKIPDLQEQDIVSWIIGDSNFVLETAIDKTYDFVFSCPPYHDLEQYSDDPADLSNMDYPEFIAVYRSIIAKSISKLKENRFACFVVGDIRDKGGFYRDFVGDTVQAFRDAGAGFYNEIILINVAGSLPIRIGRQFEGYRKVGKMHQNVLVFYKGDPKAIKSEFPKIEVDSIISDHNYQQEAKSMVID